MIVVYDVTNHSSFDNVGYWFEQIEQHATRTVDKLLVGNKSDLEGRQVEYAAGQRRATKMGTEFLECSAKTAENVEQAFVAMAGKIKSRFGPPINHSGPDSIQIRPGDMQPVDNSWGCCGY